jgi:hypothetical protein
MSQLCSQCRHRRLPDKTLQQSLSASGGSYRMQAALNELRESLKTAERQEQMAYDLEGRGVAALERRPVEHEWCWAQSKTREGVFYFCGWLKGDNPKDCKFFEAMDGASATGYHSAAVATVSPLAPARPDAVAAPGAKPAEWSLPLGTAYRLKPTSDWDAVVGAGSFNIDYEEEGLEVRPAITGEGLAQTYLLFGGPGAGKTYYFKYLLSSLLAHPRRPGCLLLDPKGALTVWLEDVLKALGRSKDLFLISASASESAFNVLGRDLSPKELGRLLSEVVLAGAAGIDEGWAVLIGDLLEAASVVIAAEDRNQLTAEFLLKDILYRAPFKHADGRHEMQYPIV